MAKKQTDSPAVKTMRRLAQKDAAWLLGFSDRTLRNHHDAPRLPSGLYDGQALVAWYAARSAGGSDGDPLLSGGASPALESYRKFRAGLAEIELNERKRRMVDIDVFLEWWQVEVAGPIRRTIEALQRLETVSGPDAAAMMTKALGQTETAVEQRMDP
jgi:hypothetical protein